MADQPESAPPSVSVVRVYNRYLVNLLMQAKTDRPDAVKALLRETGHKAIDEASPAYIQHAARQLDADGQALLKRLSDESAPVTGVDGDEAAGRFEPLPGVAIARLFEASGASERTYLFMFAVLAATHLQDDAALSSTVMRALADGGEEDEEDDAEVAIFDEDIAALVRKVHEAEALEDEQAAADDEKKEGGRASQPEEAKSGEESVMDALKGNTIASLASEITEELKLPEMLAGSNGNIADLLDFSKLTDSGSLLGSIVGKVSSKIQSKLETGELDQQALLGEAMGFLQAMQCANNKGGGGRGGRGGGGGNAKTRRKLRGKGGGGGNNPSMADAMSMAMGMLGRGGGDLSGIIQAMGGAGAGGGLSGGPAGGLDMNAMAEMFKSAQSKRPNK